MSDENLPETKAHPIMAVEDNGPLASLLDTRKFDHIWRVATVFAKSTMVPDHCRNNPSNCFILTQFALRNDVDPFMVMQNSYIVNGRPGLEAKLAIALLNRSRVLLHPVRYEMSGEGVTRCCTASGIEASDGSTRIEAVVDMEMAKAEGWIDKKGSKWKTMPEVMLKYRAAMFLIRLHHPEILMGMQYDREELESMPPIDVMSSADADAALAAAAALPAPMTTPESEASGDPAAAEQEPPEPDFNPPSEEELASNRARMMDEFRGLITAVDDKAAAGDLSTKIAANTTLSRPQKETLQAELATHIAKN